MPNEPRYTVIFIITGTTSSGDQEVPGKVMIYLLSQFCLAFPLGMTVLLLKKISQIRCTHGVVMDAK
jgi:hypothetical protein